MFDAKFYANTITVNGTGYTMKAGGGLSNISVDPNATHVMQQVNVMFLNSTTPIVLTNVMSLF